MPVVGRISMIHSHFSLPYQRPPLLSWFDKDKAPEGKCVSALHPGWDGRKRGIYPAINVKLCFLKNPLWFRVWIWDGSVNIRIKRPHVWKPLCQSFELPSDVSWYYSGFFYLKTELKPLTFSAWIPGVSNTAVGRTSCRGSATYQGKAYIYFCLCLYWDFLPLCSF